ASSRARRSGDSRWPRSAPPRSASGVNRARSSLDPVADEGHEIDELHVGPGRGLRPFEHDRAERAGRDDRARAGGLKLLEPDAADAGTGFFFLVRKGEPAARAETVRIVAVPFGLFHIRAEAREQGARLVHRTRVPSEIARIVIGHLLALLPAGH